MELAMDGDDAIDVVGTEIISFSETEGDLVQCQKMLRIALIESSSAVVQERH